MKTTTLINEKKIGKEIATIVNQSYVATNAPVINPEDVTLSYFFDDKLLVICLIREGVTTKLFTEIQASAPFNLNEWADFLNISGKSLSRYLHDSKAFKAVQSEKIIEMTEVTYKGLEVFGNMDTFKAWLETPNYALGNLTPKKLLKDSYGKELVLAELHRINYGIFA